jgi:hypothetical protein
MPLAGYHALPASRALSSRRQPSLVAAPRSHAAIAAVRNNCHAGMAHTVTPPAGFHATSSSASTLRYYHEPESTAATTLNNKISLMLSLLMMLLPAMLFASARQ